MEFHIRKYEEVDEQRVVDLSLKAWSAVFAGNDATFGPELNLLLHGDDWRAYQTASVRSTLRDEQMMTLVADAGGEIVGFVAATVRDPRRKIGEIEMLAVAPQAQRCGVGSALTEAATDWLRSQGMAVSMIETGGNPGHSPARRTYEKANYRLVPVARYFKVL